MADESSHVGRTVDDIKRQITSKLDEAARLIVTVNTLEEMIGAAPSRLADFLAGDSEEAAPSTANHGTAAASRSTQPSSFGRSGSRFIKPDQFLGQPPLEAAKQYLGMVGHAAHFDEIADAVQRGGAATKGSDWRDKLEVSLVRSVYEVVKVQDKTFGLMSFYTPEQIQGLRGTRRGAERKDKPKKKGKGRLSKPAKSKAQERHHPTGATPKRKKTADDDADAEPKA